MKKELVVVGIFCLGLVLLTCGCTQDEDGDGGGTSGSTVTMTAEEYGNDLAMDIDWSSYITIGFTSLEEGDTLIIHDTISEINYDSDADATQVTVGSGTSTVNPWFEGDITGTYAVGDEVKITVTIKHVAFSNEGMDYDMEIFNEVWESEEYFIANSATTLQGFKAQPLSTIVKV